MNYLDLSNLWVENRSNHNEWYDSLNKIPEELRNAIGSHIGAPLYANDAQFHDIGVVELTKNGKFSQNALSDKAVLPNGEVFFGISFRFENLNGLKGVIIPVIIRFLDGKPQYGFYDSYNGTTESLKRKDEDIFNPDIPEETPIWENDIKIFISQLITRVADFLKVDPKNGPFKSALSLI